MPANTPEQATQLLAEALGAGDIEALVALYEDDATFFPDPSQPAVGIAAIREVFAGFAASKPTLKVENIISIISGEIGLTQNTWTLETVEEDGTPVEGEGQPAEALRRQSDGNWKFVIDNPWGIP